MTDQICADAAGFVPSPDDLQRAKREACPDLFHKAGASDAAAGRASNVWAVAARLRVVSPSSTMGEALAYRAGYRRPKLESAGFTVRAKAWQDGETSRVSWLYVGPDGADSDLFYDSDWEAWDGASQDHAAPL